MELIQTFSQAQANALAFQGVSEHTHSKAFINLEHFVHWYYFPDEEVFAPAKFIAYVDSTIEGYSAHGRHVNDAQETLARWFRRLDPEDYGFPGILAGLERFLEHHGAHLHGATRNITGGIFVPV